MFAKFSINMFIKQPKEKCKTRCYDTTNFDSLARIGTIGEKCTLHETLSTIIYIVTTMASAGVFLLVFTFAKDWFVNVYTVTKHIQCLFRDIIHKYKLLYFQDQKTEEECSNEILSLIQKNLKHELTNPSFTLSSDKIEKILLKSISNEWSGIPSLIKQDIIENLFNGLN